MASTSIGALNDLGSGVAAICFKNSTDMTSPVKGQRAREYLSICCQFLMSRDRPAGPTIGSARATMDNRHCASSVACRDLGRVPAMMEPKG